MFKYLFTVRVYSSTERQMEKLGGSVSINDHRCSTSHFGIPRKLHFIDPEPTFSLFTVVFIRQRFFFKYDQHFCHMLISHQSLCYKLILNLRSSIFYR